MAVGESESPAVARHRLRQALRQARDTKGLTQRQVAGALDWSLSKVNRIEAGEVTVSSTDLRALLGLLEITDPDRVTELLAEARASRRRGWWDQPEYREHLPPALLQLVQFEAEASTIRAFQPSVVPGLLQTRRYATAVMASLREVVPDQDRVVRIDARLQRREQVFERPDPPEYLLALEESVLLRHVGGPGVMLEQLTDLLDLIRRERIVVRILPLAEAVSITGTFIICATDDEDVLLYRESYLADEVVYAPGVIRHHRQLFEQVWSSALSEDASIHLIEMRAATVRSELDRQRPTLEQQEPTVS